FWRTVAVKSSNDVTRLQALVDKKRVVVTEAAIRDALYLDDAEGVDCLPNEEIFTELARMEEQGDEEEQGTDNAVAEEPITAIDDVADQSIQSPTPLNPPPQQPQDIPLTSQVQSPPPQQQSPPPAQPRGAHFPMSLLQEALDACVALTRRVEHLEHDKVAQDLEILKLKTRVKKLERANKVKTVKLKRLRKVGTSQRIESSDDTLMEDAHIYHIDMDHAAKVLSMQEDESEVQEAVEVVTTAKLITEVIVAVCKIVSAAVVIPFAVLKTISAAVIPTVTAFSIKVDALVKAVVPSIMGDEHLDTIPATESDEFIKSSVENLDPNPSESEGENGCDVPSCFTTFYNILFDDEYEFDSVDNQSLHNEDFPEEIFSNPLFEEEINSMRIGQHHFNAESDLIGSLLNRDSLIISSSLKIDSLLDEFADELTLLKSIPPEIDKTDCYPENEIRLSQRLLYDNSSPHDESFSPSPIMEEIDLTFTPDDPMPPSIEEDDDDSRDTLIREKLLDMYSLQIPENESFHFDVPLSSRPPAKPPDGLTLTRDRCPLQKLTQMEA
nr:hypothetical protein [Tanacetum cinerariifolium]